MVLFFSLLLTPIGAVQAEGDRPTAGANQSNDHVLQLAIDGASGYIMRHGVENEWQAIGLAKAGKEIPETYGDHFQATLQQQVISKSVTEG